MNVAVEPAVLAELASAGVQETVAGRVALLLARRLDAPLESDTGEDLASLSTVLRDAIASALTRAAAAAPAARASDTATTVTRLRPRGRR